MPLDDEQWTKLARELRRAAARVVPAWTDADTRDPGVTVLQLLVYALDELAYRSGALNGDARALAHRVAERAAMLASAAGAGACGAGLRRPRYFPGQLLDADDLNAEQDYVLDRLARRNRLLVGIGIVDGLRVTVESGVDGPEVVVEPGLAFDRLGREIFVDRCRRLALPASGAALVVQIAYLEQPCRGAPAPATAGSIESGDEAALRAARIVETFDATLAAAPDENALGIARVHRVRGRWRVDPAFAPPHVRR